MFIVAPPASPFLVVFAKHRCSDVLAVSGTSARKTRKPELPDASPHPRPSASQGEDGRTLLARDEPPEPSAHLPTTTAPFTLPFCLAPREPHNGPRYVGESGILFFFLPRHCAGWEIQWHLQQLQPAASIFPSTRCQPPTTAMLPFTGFSEKSKSARTRIPILRKDSAAPYDQLYLYIYFFLIGLSRSTFSTL